MSWADDGVMLKDTDVQPHCEQCGRDAVATGMILRHWVCENCLTSVLGKVNYARFLKRKTKVEI